MRASLQQQELPSCDLAVQHPDGGEITAQDGAQDEYVEGGTSSGRGPQGDISTAYYGDRTNT